MPILNKDMTLCISLAGRPSNRGTRFHNSLYDELGLADPSLGDDALIAAMLAHPALINRPIVVSPKGTRLCRPGDSVVELLPL